MPKNEAIGTVECPIKGCTEQCSVYRYQERSDAELARRGISKEKSLANRRFVGKLYGRCPRHGRFGGDPGDDSMQEYIADNSKKITAAAGDGQPALAKTPAKGPTRSPAAPANRPAPPPAQPPAKGGGFWEGIWD